MKTRTNTASWLENQNRWQIKVQKDGIRKTFTCSTPGRTGQRICNKKADEWLDEGIVHTKTKISSLYKEWIEDLKLTTSPYHYKQYDGYGHNWILPSIGNKQISALSEYDLQKIINKAHTQGLAKKTLTNIRACMMSFLKYARTRKLTTLFVDSLKIPKGAKTSTKNILMPADLKVLFESELTTLRGKVIKDPYIYAYRFAVATGLRPGELLGLKWSDIRGGYVYMQRSKTVDNDFTEGKNQNARRTFKLTEISTKILKDQLAFYKTSHSTSDFLFFWEDEFVKYKTFEKYWRRYLEYNKIPKVTLYELRHTFVSLAKSLPPSALKSLVGHSEAMDTLGVYGHELEGEKEQTAELLNAALKKHIKI